MIVGVTEETTSIAREDNNDYFAHVDGFISKKIVSDDKPVSLCVQPKGMSAWTSFPLDFPDVSISNNKLWKYDSDDEPSTTKSRQRRSSF